MQAVIDSIDWQQDGPWLALLGLLLGLGLLLAVFDLLDRWAASHLAIDRVALATRYGGFMNSWAVFGRGATDYRDLKPMFPGAEAAEMARYGDGTACIVARFNDPAQARAQIERGNGRSLGSFAAAGVEIGEAGLTFATAEPGERARYRLGQWLAVEDTLLAVYGPDAASLAKRRRQLPCLQQRTILPVFVWLRSRAGFSLLAGLWLLLLGAGLVPLLERVQAARPLAGAAVQDEAGLRRALQALGEGRSVLRVTEEGDVLRIERRVDDPRLADLLDLSEGGRFVAALELRFDDTARSVSVLRLAGRLQGSSMAGQPPLPPARWFNLAGLGPDDGALRDVARAAVLAAGWQWQPRLF
ncbi:hypothetical protein [Ferrovibrio sp.]|uniref:hypothetical protein n=1 Tax=Ferrovibrio sp. TaxID=1917215 RepID=UPI003D14050C